MSKLNLTLSCWNYDRMQALRDGSVQADYTREMLQASKGFTRRGV